MKPSISVAMPLYNMGKIVELAIHGLVNQIASPYWELLICEEDNKLSYGKSRVMSWKDELTKSGCVRIEYISIKDWIPLGQKWKILAESASNTACFVLQAGDCLPHKSRLRETFDAFDQKGCNYYDEQMGYFYSYSLDKTIIFNPNENYQHHCRLNMAWSTQLIKKLPNNDRRRIVDSFLFSTLSKYEKITKHRNYNFHKDGVDVDGYNNISNRSKFFKEESDIFEFTNVDLPKAIPILEKFKGLELTKNKIK